MYGLNDKMAVKNRHFSRLLHYEKQVKNKKYLKKIGKSLAKKEKKGYHKGNNIEESAT